MKIAGNQIDKPSIAYWQVDSAGASRKTNDRQDQIGSMVGRVTRGPDQHHGRVGYVGGVQVAAASRLNAQIFDPSKYNQRNLSFQCVWLS
jgi:hypothetical protein